MNSKILYSLLIPILLVGCSSNQELANIKLTKENIEYFGYEWENEEKLYSYCKKLDNNSCTEEECPQIELVKIAYLLKNVPPEYYHLLGCTAIEDGKLGLDGKSYIGISKIIPLTTTYRENHTYQICCEIDTNEVRSNEICFDQVIPAFC